MSERIIMRYQRTINKSIELLGIGLHTGKTVSLKLSPAPTDTGIVFTRTDKNSTITAHVDNVVATDFSSTLGWNGSSVQTVEHLLAAAAGLNIDNLYIELDSSEVPIMDGSAQPFVKVMLKSGIIQQDKIKSHIKILDTVEIREKDKFIKIEPSPFPYITYIMDYDHPMLNKQEFVYHYSIESFIKDIAPARTFGFLKDVEALQKMGLGMGGSLENVVVLDDDAILNKEGLRFKDEFIRHKVLDLIGDLSLMSMSFIGHITAYRSGHNLNTRLASAILSSQNKWQNKLNNRWIEAGQNQ